MIQKFSMYVCCALIGSAAFAQDQSKQILDNLKKKTESYTTLKIKFTSSLVNKVDNVNETQQGELITKGNNYFLNMDGQKVICNGSTVWTYLEDAGEVQVSNVDEDDEDAVNPANLFTIYEKGHKTKYSKETTVNGIKVDEINLYPIDPGAKSYHTIKLYIDKVNTEIVKMMVLGKEGSDYIFEVIKLEKNTPIPDSKFTFKPIDYPGVDVIDLRE